MTVSCSFCARDATVVNKIISGPGVYICDGCVRTCDEILAADDGRSDVPLPEWRSASDDELLASLPRVAATAATVETGLRARVTELRDRGVTWARIGAALGMTRQSAWERFTGA